MAATISIAPITRIDEWTDFVAELEGPRRVEWAQSQRRRGITRQVISRSHSDPAFAIVYTEVTDADEADRTLATSTDPFDQWFRDRVGDLHGDWLPTEVVFDSAPRRGPWRGWRR